MKKFGILLNSLGISQQGLSITKNLNALVERDPYISPVVFYREYAPMAITPGFAMMQDVNAWGFDAPIIATNISSAQRLLEYPRPTKKFLYVTDLEWGYHQNLPYEYFDQTYRHKELFLIARSKSHYDIIAKHWKQPVGIVQDWNYQQLSDIL
jgi:hypothetical protein